MTDRFQTVSPIDGSIVAERCYATRAEIDAALDRARDAWPTWRRTPVSERVRLLTALVKAVEADRDQIAAALTLQMGRPCRFADGEIGGFAQRARHMLDIAPDAMSSHIPDPKPGFRRFVRPVPHGLVLVLSPWNYPLLTAVNAVVPALAAGNVVLLKHSEQTPLCAEQLVAAGRRAGLPPGVFEFVHMANPQTATVVADPRVDFVAFTGSEAGGRAIQRAAVDRFIKVGLELGGKDPAYVRRDVDIAAAAGSVVEGALFNSGQSCCAVERIYVHDRIFDDFVEAAVAAARGWTLGDPREPETLLGPVVRASNARAIQEQIDAAVAAGARTHIDPESFSARGLPYLPPQILTGVSHDMALMRDETFGPCVGIMPVSGDREAVERMNDSRYGLTASIWTRDIDAAQSIGAELHTGTVFANRCDALDPALAWVGARASGRGCTLSFLGYIELTRPQSFHLRMPPRT